MEKERVQDEEVEEVDEFVYLGAKVSKDGGGTEDIKNRLRKAKGAFQSLTKVWNTGRIGKKTKISLFKTLVRSVLLYGCASSVLLYGCETWKTKKCEEKKLDAFQSKCLRRILRIRWPTRVIISNKEIMDIASVNSISDEIRRRRWKQGGETGALQEQQPKTERPGERVLRPCVPTGTTSNDDNDDDE